MSPDPPSPGPDHEFSCHLLRARRKSHRSRCTLVPQVSLINSLLHNLEHRANVREGKWTMSKVLLVGEDETLLQTRAAVVRTAGVESICCKPEAALSFLSQQSFELVILCHSLSEYTCASLAYVIHEHWPATALLAVSAATNIPQVAKDPPLVTITSAEPELLVLQVLELMHSRRPPQASRPGNPPAYLAARGRC